MKLSKVKTWVMAVIVGIFSISTLLLSLLFSPNINNRVDAFTSVSSSNAVTVGNIWDSATQSFDLTNMRTLLSYISSDGTIEGVNTNNQNAENIRGYVYGGKTNGQAVVVTLGNYQWQVVYLTKDNYGNRIATLLMANNDGTATYGNSSSNYGPDSFTSGFPTSMYGTSHIRAVTLNNGGQYINITSNSSTPTTTVSAGSPSTTHKYALYTAPSLGLTQYLVQPNNVWYQTEPQLLGGDNPMDYTLNNESLATNITTGWFQDDASAYSYQTKGYYTQWGADYLWIPSISETGTSDSDSGIWGLSKTERSASTNWWSRSGYCSNSNSAYPLSSSGGSSIGAYYVRSSYGVRAALHLNLDTAALSAVNGAVTTTLDDNVSVTPTYSTNEDGTEDIVTLTFSPKTSNVSKISLTIDNNPIIISTSEESARLFINVDGQYQYKCYNDENGSILLIIRALMKDINVTATSVGITASFTGGSGTIESFREGDILYVIAHPQTGQYVNTITIDGATITPTYYKATIYGAGNSLNVRYTAMDATNLFIMEFENQMAASTVVFNLATTRPQYEIPPTVNGGGGVGIVGTVATATSGGEVRMVGNDIANGEDTDTVTFIALAYSGYRFVGWVNANDEDETFGTSTNISLTKEQVNGKVIKAVFEAIDTSNANSETNNQDEFL